MADGDRLCYRRQLPHPAGWVWQQCDPRVLSECGCALAVVWQPQADAYTVKLPYGSCHDAFPTCSVHASCRKRVKSITTTSQSDSASTSTLYRTRRVFEPMAQVFSESPFRRGQVRPRGANVFARLHPSIATERHRRRESRG